jgi:hypothetical protein
LKLKAACIPEQVGARGGLTLQRVPHLAQDAEEAARRARGLTARTFKHLRPSDHGNVRSFLYCAQSIMRHIYLISIGNSRSHPMTILYTAHATSSGGRTGDRRNG